MSELTQAGLMVGAALSVGLPVLLLIFGIITIRAGRRGELASPISQESGWLLCIGLVSLALYLFGSVSRLPSLGWVSVLLLLLAAVLCGRLLQSPLARPLKIVSWLLLFDLIFVAAFGSFSVWIAGKAAQLSAYNNTNEAEVRTAIRINPNDAAAHSSLAHIDMMRGDHVGEVAEWRQVLRVEPDNLDALLLLGGALSRDGKVDEARPLFQRLAARHDQFSVNAHKWLARHAVQ